MPALCDAKKALPLDYRLMLCCFCSVDFQMSSVFLLEYFN